MRRILRAELPRRLLFYLEKKQREVDSGGIVSTLWKQARNTQAMKQAFGILASMGGGRQRCMFCEDSRGVDIDHFWPKDAYPLVL